MIVIPDINIKNIRVNFSSIIKFNCITLCSVAALSLFANYVWALDNTKILNTESHNAILSIKQNSNPINSSCRFLLNSQAIKTDQTLNQRSATQLAALGLVVGMRIAVQPADDKPFTNHMHSGIHSEDIKQRNAYTIAKYRNCQKEQALKQSQTNYI